MHGRLHSTEVSSTNGLFPCSGFTRPPVPEKCEPGTPFSAVTWNVCGLSECDWPAFISNVNSEVACWDALLLQEANSLAYETTTRLPGGHLLYLCAARAQARSVGIVLNSKWAEYIANCGGSDRVCFMDLQISGLSRGIRLVSAHMPYNGGPYGDDDLDCALHQLSSQLCRHRDCVIGIDANCEVGPFSEEARDDHRVLGPFGLGHRLLSGSFFLEWCRSHKLSVVNTHFANASLPTHVHWVTGNMKQLDFVLAHWSSQIISCNVLSNVGGTTDHLPVKVDMMMGPRGHRNRRKTRKPVGWQLKDEAAFQVGLHKLNETSNLSDFTSELTSLASNTGSAPKPPYTWVADDVLQELLRSRRLERDRGERRKLSIAIFVRRKALRKESQTLRVQRMLEQKTRSGWGKNLWPQTSVSSQPSGIIIEGSLCHDRTVWKRDLTRFYKNLYNTDLHFDCGIGEPSLSEEGPSHGPFSVEEVSLAISKLKRNKTCHDDGCVSEMIQALPDEGVTHLTELLNDVYLGKSKPPDSWAQITVILLPKVAQAHTWPMFRPIAILPCLVKLWDAMLLSRILPAAKARLLPSQFAFLPGKSITEPTMVLQQVCEKAREWGRTLFIMKLDLNKAFDSIMHQAILDALCDADIPRDIINAIVHGYKGLLGTFRLNEAVTSDSVPIQRGVRQGSPLSPLLFILVLNLALRRCNDIWRAQGKGFSLDGKFLLNLLGFADDLLLIAETADQLQAMIVQLNMYLKPLGLEMNFTKCRWASNCPSTSTITCAGTVIPYIPFKDPFPFLGYSHALDGRSKEAMSVRLAAAWRGFFSRMDVWKSKAPLNSKLAVLQQTVEQVALFGSEVWTPSCRDRAVLNTTLLRMIRKIMRRGRRPLAEGYLEPWVEWWIRTGRLARKSWIDAGFKMWSTAAARRKWLWAFKISAGSADIGFTLVNWRSIEWQRQQERILRHKRETRPSPGKPWRWETVVHRFWERRGYVWLDRGEQAVSEDLWFSEADKFEHWCS